MDRKDREILTLLQADASLSMADLADRISLSRSAVWRRVRDLEQQRAETDDQDALAVLGVHQAPA